MEAEWKVYPRVSGHSHDNYIPCVARHVHFRGMPWLCLATRIII